MTLGTWKEVVDAINNGQKVIDFKLKEVDESRRSYRGHNARGMDNAQHFAAELNQDPELNGDLKKKTIELLKRSNTVHTLNISATKATQISLYTSFGVVPGFTYGEAIEFLAEILRDNKSISNFSVRGTLLVQQGGGYGSRSVSLDAELKSLATSLIANDTVTYCNLQTPAEGWSSSGEDVQRILESIENSVKNNRFNKIALESKQERQDSIQLRKLLDERTEAINASIRDLKDLNRSELDNVRENIVDMQRQLLQLQQISPIQESRSGNQPNQRLNPKFETLALLSAAGFIVYSILDKIHDISYTQSQSYYNQIDNEASMNQDKSLVDIRSEGLSTSSGLDYNRALFQEMQTRNHANQSFVSNLSLISYVALGATALGVGLGYIYANKSSADNDNRRTGEQEGRSPAAVASPRGHQRATGERQASI